ncbi:DUF461 domain-containing protein [Streptomyces sp. NBC_01619]|uniref:DUF461 domain-containing protein n=1 Tax=Streptomyces pratisoli TaxID=3139917 RepID=A0ACC6QIH4_9ACTN|nr:MULTISPECIES: DUF461 domain-containing protein [unclassified Streptomyces]MCX4511687.1 DUF461 domain-containing protein [Streptomyces sp. NBC_01619]
MSSSLRRGVLAATALAISIAPLSACAAGNDAQTLGVKPDNAATTVGDIQIQNATVITQPELNAQGPAVVSATLFNNGQQQQTLDSITLPGSNTVVKLAPATGSGPITIPALGSVVLGGKGNASALIDNSKEAGKSGEAQKIVFRFSETGDVPIEAFVVPAAGFYHDYGPTGVPKPPAEKPAASPSAPAEGAHGDEAEEGGAHGEENGGEATTTPSDPASASHEAGH